MSQFYTQVKNPQWANVEQTIINCEVNFNHLNDEFVPFTADPTDSMEYSKTIFDECLAGQYGEISEYVAPPPPPAPSEPTKEELMAKLLEIQNQINNLE
jgi:hypothetical protein